MPEIKKNTILKIELTRDLNTEDSEALSKFLGSLGLIARKDQTPSDGRLASVGELTKDLLSRHTLDTLPYRPKDFIGKEHFWYFAYDYPKPKVAGLFTALVAPRSKNYSYTSPEVDPKDIGLIVKERGETDLPPVPEGIQLGYSGSQSARAAHKVIQVGGLIALGEAMYPDARLHPVAQCHQMGNYSLEILQVATANLAAHLKS